MKGTARIEIDLLASSSGHLAERQRSHSLKKVALEVGGVDVPVRGHTVGGEFLGIEMPTLPGPVKSAFLTVNYRGHIQDKQVLGPYRRMVEGQWYVYTTFTPIEARRAFPCFDEPRFKTPWEISIHVRRDLKAFSNAVQVSETDEAGGMKLVRFAPTERLASEVVAFEVGPFDIYKAANAGVPPVRVLTPMGHAAEGQAGSEATAKVLPRLVEYTGMRYPWSKLDHLALPVGAFGAVENPGSDYVLVVSSPGAAG